MVSGTTRYVEGSLARALPQEQVRRKTKVVGKKRPMAAIALVAIVGVALGLAFLAQFAATARLSYQNESLNQQIGQLSRENSELELKIEQLGSLERIERVATEKLGMIKPDAGYSWEHASK